MKGMGRLMAAALLTSGVVGWAAETPKVETLSDAEIYVKVKTEELEKEKAAAIAAAQADAEREAALKQLAQVGDLKRELIGERARIAELQKKLEDMTQILKTIPVAAPAPTPERWGQPVFADDFAGAGISDKWSKKGLDPKSNVFQVAEGMLTGKEKISLAPTFSGKAVRVEYDTFTASETPCDASVFAEASETPVIFAGIGSEMNQQCRINIGSEEVARKDSAFLKGLRRQHMGVEIGEGKVRVEVDGAPAVEYAGEKAPKELKDVTLSLYTFTPGMNFDNVKVFVVK